MVTLVASSKGNPFCRSKPDATWPRKALTHLVLGLATNHRKMVGKLFLNLSINLGFLIQNEKCLVVVLILEQTLTSGQLFYFISYRAIYRKTWDSFTCLSFGTAHQQFLTRICLTFMESTILDKTVEKIAYLGSIFLNVVAVPVLPSPPSPESSVVVYSKENLIPGRL